MDWLGFLHPWRGEGGGGRKGFATMARVNVDDDIESRLEYRKLLKLLGGDEDRALGMLVRFWRIAQKLWGEEKLVPVETIEEWGFQPLVESKWAVLRPGVGYYAIGSEKRFAWYVQRVKCAQAGGRARSAASRDERGRLQPDTSRDPAGHQPEVPIIQPDSSPLALAPSLVKKEEEEIQAKENLTACKKTWLETLAAMGAPRGLASGEDLELLRAIRTHGPEDVDRALYGARFQTKSGTFDPVTFTTLPWIFGKNKKGEYQVSRFLSLAAANPPRSNEIYDPEAEQSGGGAA